MNLNLSFIRLVILFGILFYETSAICIESKYNLNQLVDLALSQSHLIKALTLETSSKENLADQAGRWGNPSVEVGAEKKEEIGGSTNYFKAGLSQPIFFPGRFSIRSDVAHSETAISKSLEKESELTVKYDVINLTFALQVAIEKANHAEERLRRFKTIEGFIRSRVFASPQKRTEANIVSSKLLILQKELLKTNSEKNLLWSQLNFYLNLQSQPQIQVDWFKNGPQLNFESLISQARKSNLLVERQQISVQKALDESRLSRIEAFPGIILSASIANGTGFNPEKIYGLGLSLPIPIWNANGSAIKAGELKHGAELERLNLEQDALTRNLQMFLLKYKNSQLAIVQLPISQIPSLEKEMSVTDQQFRKGRVDLLTYLESDSQHTQSIEAILDAQVEFVKSLSEIKMTLNDSNFELER